VDLKSASCSDVSRKFTDGKLTTIFTTDEMVLISLLSTSLVYVTLFHLHLLAQFFTGYIDKEVDDTGVSTVSITGCIPQISLLLYRSSCGNNLPLG
jgi:hypothetical protein